MDYETEIEKLKAIPAPFHAGMKCYVRTLDYNFAERRGSVLMGEMSCTDMSGAIDTFQRIDPDVEVIETGTFDGPDTTYRRNADGEWLATYQKGNS